MFNICMQCGEYRTDKIIDQTGRHAICPVCGCSHSFLRLPVFAVTGASGSGKSRLAIELAKIQKDFVVIECDIFWREEFHQHEGDFRVFREFCLRAAKNIGQAGKPVVLCGAASPPQYENCSEFRYFSDIFYLVLICEENELRKRLKGRPEYRRSRSDEFIKKQQEYNKFLKELAKTHKNMEILDSTKIPYREMAEKALEWLRSHYKA